MFPWPANRTIPKVKTTYTRKKLSYPAPAAQDQDTPIDSGAEDNMAIEAESMMEGESMVEEGESVVEMGESKVAEDESMLEAGKPMAPSTNDSDVNTAGLNPGDAQVHQEAESADKVLSDEEPATNIPEDNEETYEVEYFMADGYKNLPGSKIPQKVLLTKWAGFDLVSDLTWEPESEMRDDVPDAVKAYYKGKINGPSTTHPEAASKKPRGRQPIIAKATRGRPRKDSKIPLGRPPKVTKARGRPRKDSKAPLGRPPKNASARRGRPPKVRAPETA